MVSQFGRLTASADHLDIETVPGNRLVVTGRMIWPLRPPRLGDHRGDRAGRELRVIAERSPQFPHFKGTGCGAAWLARLLWEQEAAGSNPAIPTDHSCISNGLPQNDFPGETVLMLPDVALWL
jgi:hypothetical protein